MRTRLFALAVLSLVLVCPSAHAQSLIIVVRHAERADGGAGVAPMTTAPADPLLSAPGEARAARLATMLAESGIRAIYATEFRRTQDTGKPLAAKLGLTVQQVPGRDAAALVAKLKAEHAKDVVLIIGHSNTVPDVIKAFGGPTVKMADDEYNAIYVLAPTTGALTLISTEMPHGVGSLFLALALLAAPGVLVQAPDLSPQGLARLWDVEHVSPAVSPLVDHAEVRKRIQALPLDQFRVREVGRSLENREIFSVTFGSGPNVVLMWSQMHGDEPTATSALFDLYEYVRRHRMTPHVARMLASLTVHTVPMLNPDGAERFQRRNVQGLDINRDALLVQSPEGQILKRLRDDLNPFVGFNLHNQNWNTTAGRPPKPASISLLSVAYDDARSVNEGRLLTKRLGAIVRDAVEALAPGQVGKYDDEFEVRAFGDNITKWGTPVLLIETGPWPDVNPDPALVRLNFVALVRALTALSDGSVHKADPARYDSLPQNESRGFFYLIRNVGLRVSPTVPVFTGDVGITATRRIRMVDGTRRLFVSMSVSDLGDLRTYAGLFDVDGTGKVLAPLQPGVAIGAIVDLAQVAGTISTGTAADLMLVEPAGGMYRVVRTFSAQQEVR